MTSTLLGFISTFNTKKLNFPIGIIPLYALSAADVLAALNAYKTITDPRIQALEDVGAQANVLEKVKINNVELDIAEDKSVNIPVASASLGVVKTSAAENGVAIAADGSMSVNSVNVNKLTQTEGEFLVLYGGSAEDNI